MFPAILGIASGAFIGMPPDGCVTQPESDLVVPLPQLTRKQWLEFVRAAVQGKPDMVSPTFRLGTFGFSVRRLCDLGAMSEPKRIYYCDQPVWDGRWKEPRSLREF